MSNNYSKGLIARLPECAQGYPMLEGYKFDMKLFESQMKRLHPQACEVDSMILACVAMIENTRSLKHILAVGEKDY